MDWAAAARPANRATGRITASPTIVLVPRTVSLVRRTDARIGAISSFNDLTRIQSLQAKMISAMFAASDVNATMMMTTSRVAPSHSTETPHYPSFPHRTGGSPPGGDTSATARRLPFVLRYEARAEMILDNMS